MELAVDVEAFASTALSYVIDSPPTPPLELVRRSAAEHLSRAVAVAEADEELLETLRTAARRKFRWGDPHDFAIACFALARASLALYEAGDRPYTSADAFPVSPAFPSVARWVRSKLQQVRTDIRRAREREREIFTPPPNKHTDEFELVTVLPTVGGNGDLSLRWERAASEVVGIDGDEPPGDLLDAALKMARYLLSGLWRGPRSFKIADRYGMYQKMLTTALKATSPARYDADRAKDHPRSYNSAETRLKRARPKVNHIVVEVLRVLEPPAEADEDDRRALGRIRRDAIAHQATLAPTYLLDYIGGGASAAGAATRVDRVDRWLTEFCVYATPADVPWAKGYLGWIEDEWVRTGSATLRRRIERHVEEGDDPLAAALQGAFAWIEGSRAKLEAIVEGLR